MKKLVMALVIVGIFTTFAYATGVNTKVSSNTVTFSTTGLIVTFSTATTNVLVVNNNDSASAVHVNLNDEYIGWNQDHSKYLLPTAISQNTVKLYPGDSIAVDVATKKIGFVGEGAGSVTYVATTDRAEL